MLILVCDGVSNWHVMYLCNHVNESDLYMPIIDGGMYSKYVVFESLER